MVGLRANRLPQINTHGRVYNLFGDDLDTQQVLDTMVEISLPTPSHFRMVRETLTRMGFRGQGQDLYQICFILHKKGKYFIAHYKELLLLDKKEPQMTTEDKADRNLVACLLEDWGMVNILSAEIMEEGPISSVDSLLVISSEEKSKWRLVPKYRMGSRFKLYGGHNRS